MRLVQATELPGPGHLQDAALGWEREHQPGVEPGWVRYPGPPGVERAPERQGLPDGAKHLERVRLGRPGAEQWKEREPQA